MRVKICRKESKESKLWLELTEPLNSEEENKANLIKEAIELTKIFGSIITNEK